MISFAGTALKVLALGLAAGYTTPLLAQDPPSSSAEDLIEKFERQLGATRGLQPLSVSNLQGVSEQGEETYRPVAEADRIDIRITFDFNSSELRPDQQSKLSAMCEAMQVVEARGFRIIGHTDAAGSDDYNRDLSYRRAVAVRSHLIEDCGIPADRLSVLGMGERVLLDAGNPRAESNRRVEFQVLG